jgi:hypothetical protein
MKKITISTVLVGLTLSATSVFAQSIDTPVPAAPVITPVAVVTEKVEVIKTDVLAKVKERGAKLIKERVDTLNSNLKALESSKTLTAEQKEFFITNINTQVAGLTTLGTSIAGATDASSTKALVSKIFTDFRIYAIVVPQIRMEKRINDLQNHTVKLNETFAKVQTKIDEQKAKGKDVAAMQKSLDDAKALVAKNTATLSTLMTQVVALKPSDYPTTSKTTIESINKSIKEVAKELGSVKSILNTTKNMRGVKTASSTMAR